MTNEFSQNLEFFCATRLDPTRIVKNVTCMIGEHKFVIDGVLASLAPYSGKRRAVLTITNLY